jgi:hypothetical protein
MRISSSALTDSAALAVAVFGATEASGLAQNFATTEIQPAPAAIGADVPATYFGSQPSQVQRELVGQYQNLKSGKIDFDKGTITLPLYQGAMKSGEAVWYIVTDTDDKGNAEQLGLNYSPKLTFADVGHSTPVRLARGLPVGAARSLGIIVVPPWLPSAIAHARMAQSRPGNRRGMGC